ncbi:MAG: acetyltransferase [Candidatus Lokiarchaeota archaeon]|nr:acetyltransferase [Candidatus Lokiarchaeota archaeon]
MSERLILFGIGQNAEVAYYYFKHDSPYEIVAFTLDREWMKRDRFHNLPVIAFDEIENVYPPEKYKMFVSISFTNLNKLRKKKYQEAKEKGYELISYVCSRATTWPNLDIGDNCFIFEDNVIQPYVKIGNNVILWSGNHIGHHTTISDHCFIASHVVISGSVTVGERCFFGVNSTIRDNIKIAKNCVIGAGAIITKDTVENGIYYGPRANVLKQTGDSKNLNKI